jgi:hypothetical protein
MSSGYMTKIPKDGLGMCVGCTKNESLVTQHPDFSSRADRLILYFWDPKKPYISTVLMAYTHMSCIITNYICYA